MPERPLLANPKDYIPFHIFRVMIKCDFVHPEQIWLCPLTNTGLENAIHDICTDCHAGTEDSRIPQLPAQLLAHL
jgi:hypothetical protein